MINTAVSIGQWAARSLTASTLPLSFRSGLLRAFNRLLGLIGEKYRVQTYFGAQLVCSPKDLIQRTVLLFRVWEPYVSSLIASRLGRGDVFVDIGANVGYDALLGSSCVGAEGCVIAVEASPSTYEALTRNIEINRAENVRAVNFAASDRAGWIDLYSMSASNIGAATTLSERGGSFQARVESRPLTQILTREEIRRVRLIKIDVEGAEPAILENILDEMKFFPLEMEILVEVSPNDGVEAWQSIFNRLVLAGFSGYAVENEYTFDWYLLAKKPMRLHVLDSLPKRQQDVLFSRQDLSSNIIAPAGS